MRVVNANKIFYGDLSFTQVIAFCVSIEVPFIALAIACCYGHLFCSFFLLENHPRQQDDKKMKRRSKVYHNKFQVSKPNEPHFFLSYLKVSFSISFYAFCLEFIARICVCQKMVSPL